MNKSIFYRLFFFLAGLQGGYALYSLLSIPGDPKKALLFGLSYERMLLIGFPIIVIVICGYLLAKTLWDKEFGVHLDRKIHGQLSRDHRLSLAILVCGLLIVFGGIFTSALSQRSFYILAPPELRRYSYMVYFVDQIYALAHPYLVRVQPLIFLLSGLCFQAIVAMLAIMSDVRAWFTHLRTQKIHIIIGVFVVFLIFWRVIGWNRLTLSPDYGDSEWLPLGTPILETQVFLAFILGCIFVGLGLIINRFYRAHRQFAVKARFVNNRDLTIGLLIWFVAAAYWLSLPTQASRFLDPPLYPNYAYYPNSDAFTYDTTAQNLLIGNGFKTRDLDYPRRPVYALFLAYLYSIVGQNYEAITMVQSAILACFPALIYLLTARLQNRLSALIAATLVTLREGNAIVLAGATTATNSKMLMSEVPAAVGMVLLVLMVGLWMRRPLRRDVYSLLIGGILAFFMLVRIEIEVFLLLYIIFIGVQLFRQPKKWLTNIFMVTLGIVLFLAPWIWRNWKLTGRIYVEQPNERISYILTKTGISASNVPPTNLTTPETLAKDNAIRKLLRRTLSHYINNQAQAILMFPDAYRLIDSAIGFFGHDRFSGFVDVCCSREDYISRLFPLWHEWNGNLPEQSILPIMVTLLIISIGLTSVWKTHAGYGILPFALVITHYVTSGVVRVSGGRFVQIVDWVWIVYYSVGLGYLVTWLYSSLVRHRLPSSIVDQSEVDDSIVGDRPALQQTSWKIYFGLGLVLLVVGALLPITEYVIKPRYTLQTKQLWLGEIKQSKTFLSDYPQIKLHIEDITPDDPRVLQGRALYPRYYPIGESDLDYEAWNSPRAYDRFSFYLVGPVNTGVVVQLDRKPAINFPHAADVLIIGCQDEGFFKGLIVYVKSTGTILLSSPFPDAYSCLGRVTITQNRD